MNPDSGKSQLPNEKFKGGTEEEKKVDQSNYSEDYGDDHIISPIPKVARTYETDDQESALYPVRVKRLLSSDR